MVPVVISGLLFGLTPVRALGVAIRRKDMADNRLFSVRFPNRLKGPDT